MTRQFHKQSLGTQLHRWRVAADPPPAPEAAGDPFEPPKVEDKKPVKPGIDPRMYGLVNQLAVKAKEALNRYKLGAELIEDDPRYSPQAEGNGIDLTYRLLSPEFKGGLLTFSWTKKGPITEWLRSLVGKVFDQLTLYFCDAIYVATGNQLDPFLSALRTIQSSVMHAATKEETEVYELIKKHMPEVDSGGKNSSEESTAELDRILAVVHQLQSNEPRLDLSNAGAVLEEAKDSLSSNNITKQQYDELFAYIKTNKADGWKKVMEEVESEGKQLSYKNVAFEEEVAKAVTELTDGRYKGKPAVGYSSGGGKNYVNAVLNAPFPFHFRFERKAGGELVLAGAGARICQNDYSVDAAQAKDLMYAVLALGIAAKQAAQVPDEIKHRGHQRQELSEEEINELNKYLEDNFPKRKKEPVFNGTLYKVVIDQLVKLSGRKLGEVTQKNADAVFKQEKIPGRTFAKFFQMVAKDLGFTLSKDQFQELALEVDGADDPSTLSDGVDAILHELTGVE